jgi:hypothetical protein
MGEENFKEMCIRTGPTGDKEACLPVVDRDGVAKACTQRTYPLRIVLQTAWAIPLPICTGRRGALIAEVREDSMRKLQAGRNCRSFDLPWGPSGKGRSGVRPRPHCVLWLRAGEQLALRPSWLSESNLQVEEAATTRIPAGLADRHIGVLLPLNANPSAS